MPKSRWGVLLRVSVTLVIVAVYFYARTIPLPDFFDDGPTGTEPERGASLGGITCLGLSAVLSASMFVELAALVVPRWRRLRHGGAEARAGLQQAVPFVVLLLSMFQAWSMARLARHLEEHAGRESFPFAVTIIASAFFCWALAGLVDRHGLGGGVVLLWSIEQAATTFLKPLRTWMEIPPDPDVPNTAGWIGLGAAVFVCAAATVLVMPKPRPGATIPAPSSGFLPVWAASLALQLANLIALPGLAWLAGKPWAWPLLSVVYAVPIAFMVTAERGVRPLLQRARIDAEANTLVRASLVATLSWVGVAATTQTLVVLAIPAPVQLLFLPLLVAWILDTVRDERARWRDPSLVTAWVEQRPYVVPIALHALAKAEIPAHAAGLSRRTILQFAASYAPIEIRVPEARRVDARRILQRLLPEREARKRPKKVRATPGGAAVSLTRVTVIAALGVALVGGAVWVHRKRAAEESATASTQEGRRATLELLLVADEENPFERLGAAANLPEGVVIMRENAPIGLGEGGRTRTTVVSYAQARTRGGESLDQLAARLDEWVRTLTLPPNTKVALGVIAEYDKRKDTYEDVALRTYLLRLPAQLTGRDIAVARAERDRFGSASWRAIVSMELTPEGAERFAEITGENVKRRFAIVLDGRVESAPVINERITGGRLQISMGKGSFEDQLRDAKRLARSLSGKAKVADE